MSQSGVQGSNLYYFMSTSPSTTDDTLHNTLLHCWVHLYHTFCTYCNIYLNALLYCYCTTSSTALPTLKTSFFGQD